jgi:hypothetical protein
MSITSWLSYQEWAEQDKRVVGYLLEQYVSREELFVRKLVNASVIHNKLYEHVSNESENGTRHIIYASRFNREQDTVHGRYIEEPLFANSARSEQLSIVLLCWNDGRFERSEFLTAPYDVPARTLLLDHYWVLYSVCYEIIYSVLDLDTNHVIFYLKEVSL